MSIFWDITLVLKSTKVSKEYITSVFSRAQLTNCFMLVSRLSYSSILKMEATCSSEIAVDLQRTTRRYIPEDRTPHNTCAIQISTLSENISDWLLVTVCFLN
jgi:hypothetical protein